MLGEFLAYDLDNYKGASPTAAELTSQINIGVRFVSRQIYQFDPNITLTLDTTAIKQDLRDTTTPRVSRKVLKPVAVYINGNPLYRADGRGIGLWSLDEFNRYRTNWRTQDAGTPNAAAFDGRYLWLNPKPSAVLSNNAIAGQYLAADLINSNDDSNPPDLPEELHEAVVRIAADFAADPNVSEQEGLQRLQRYAMKAGADIADIRRRNMRFAHSFGSVRGHYTSNLIQT